MIIDLDALKPINDQHGHAAGDEVIIEIAKTLRQAIRPDDVLARWGGDEFVVVAQAQHVEHATHARRARARTHRQDEVRAAARRRRAHQLLDRPHLPAVRSGQTLRR